LLLCTVTKTSGYAHNELLYGYNDCVAI
jgi:hypothetical protein